MTAASRYGEMVRAREAQLAELSTPLNETRWARWAHTYRFDPTRTPEPQLAAALEYVRAEDEIIEIGGGAGRIGLPLAGRARSLVNVEPSAAMREQFGICVAEYGIENVEVIASMWPTESAMSADLMLTVDVTYFIAEIEPFLRAMHEAARRRVLILTWTVPPPNVDAALFRAALGVEEQPSPSYRELLPVLWEMGIDAEVRIVGEYFDWPERLPRTEAEAVEFVLEQIEPRHREAAARRVSERLGKLYRREGGIWRPVWRTPSQGVLITWSV